MADTDSEKRGQSGFAAIFSFLQIQKLSSVFQRTKHIADRNMDSAHCNTLAGLSPYRFRIVIGSSRLCWSDTYLCAGPFCRCSHRSMEPLSYSDRNPDSSYDTGIYTYNSILLRIYSYLAHCAPEYFWMCKCI